MSRLGLMALLVCSLAFAGLTATAPAQDQGEGGRRGGRGFDRGEFRERIMTRFKEQLGVTDEEWQVLQPKLEKVMTAQRDARGGAAGLGLLFGGRGGRGGGQGGGAEGAQREQTPVAKASADLAQAVEANASAEDISTRLQALRDARAKAREDLEAAQKELQEIVTAKQEAIFVMAGLLE